MKTDIVAVIDRSGSMWPVASDMEGGFRNFIEQQKKISPFRITTVLFDDKYEVEAFRQNSDSYEFSSLLPRGQTALYDAIGKTIRMVGEDFQKDSPDKVILVIITDGYENSSKEYSHSMVLDMIKDMKDNFAWEIMFFGKNINEVAVSKHFGGIRTHSYDDSKQLYAEVNRAVCSVR